MPTFDQGSEDIVRRAVTCERCLEPGLYRLDVASGHFTFQCTRTQLEATEIHTLRGPGELRAIHLPGQAHALRPLSHRRSILTVHGKVFQERWRTDKGLIYQSADDYVAVHIL